MERVMRPLVVTTIPVSVLWDSSGELPLTKKRKVGRDQVSELLRYGPIKFVLADCGYPLKWVAVDDRFRFWKEEVKRHLIDPGEAETGFRLEDYPGEYCYVGSEWGGEGEVPVVLLEKHH